MKKEDNPKKKIKIPNIKIPNIKIPALKIPNVNKMKQVLAVIMLIAEIVAIIGSSMYGFQMGAISLVLFVIITFDYIRVLWAEEREGPWYELEDMER